MATTIGPGSRVGRPLPAVTEAVVRLLDHSQQFAVSVADDHESPNNPGREADRLNAWDPWFLSYVKDGVVPDFRCLERMTQVARGLFTRPGVRELFSRAFEVTPVGAPYRAGNSAHQQGLENAEQVVSLVREVVWSAEIAIRNKIGLGGRTTGGSGNRKHRPPVPSEWTPSDDQIIRTFPSIARAFFATEWPDPVALRAQVLLESNTAATWVMDVDNPEVALGDAERDILVLLYKRRSRLIQIKDIQREVPRCKQVILQAVARLQEVGYVCRPRGVRSGLQLSAGGVDYARTLPAV